MPLDVGPVLCFFRVCASRALSLHGNGMLYVIVGSHVILLPSVRRVIGLLPVRTIPKRYPTSGV